MFTNSISTVADPSVTLISKVEELKVKVSPNCIVATSPVVPSTKNNS
jgi:hypothetical protein